MPTFGPIQRRELVRCLRQLGFDGPYAGGRHQFMIKRADGTILIESKADWAKREKAAAKQAKRPAAKAR